MVSKLSSIIWRSEKRSNIKPPFDTPRSVIADNCVCRCMDYGSSRLFGTPTFRWYRGNGCMRIQATHISRRKLQPGRERRTCTNLRSENLSSIYLRTSLYTPYGSQATFTHLCLTARYSTACCESSSTLCCHSFGIRFQNRSHQDRGIRLCWHTFTPHQTILTRKWRFCHCKHWIGLVVSREKHHSIVVVVVQTNCRRNISR